MPLRPSPLVHALLLTTTLDVATPASPICNKKFIFKKGLNSVRGCLTLESRGAEIPRVSRT